MPQNTSDPLPYDRNAIFHDNGPINPIFISECIRSIMRALPLGDPEPAAWGHRRMFCAMLGLSALNPRDEIEVMIGVQALSAYHAAAACWHIGMNHHHPNGNSIRHLTSAASSARTFDAMLKALERRQAKPLGVPVGRPAGKIWPPEYPTQFVDGLAARCVQADSGPITAPIPPMAWSPEDIASTEAMMDRERVERENSGLDIANTEGILPGGGMILTDDPTPAQIAYMARRLTLMYRQEHAENQRKGIKGYPKIRGIHPGDLIP